MKYGSSVHLDKTKLERFQALWGSMEPCSFTGSFRSCRSIGPMRPSLQAPFKAMSLQRPHHVIWLYRLLQALSFHRLHHNTLLMSLQRLPPDNVTSQTALGHTTGFFMPCDSTSPTTPCNSMCNPEAPQVMQFHGPHHTMLLYTRPSHSRGPTRSRPFARFTKQCYSSGSTRSCHVMAYIRPCRSTGPIRPCHSSCAIISHVPIGFVIPQASLGHVIPQAPSGPCY